MDIKILASGSKGNCYYISDGHTPLLLECGINISRVRDGLDYKLSEIQGCLLSHEHGDHSKAVGDVLRSGIDVYMSNGTKDALGLSGHRIHTIESRDSFRVGTWTIRAFETQHDAAEPLGYFIQSFEAGERLLFATDTYYIRYKFPLLNYVMIECNYATDILQSNLDAGLIPSALKNRLLTSHFSLDNVKQFLKANDLSQVKAIYLLHLSDGNSDADRFKREIQELTGKVVYIA